MSDKDKNKDFNSPRIGDKVVKAGISIDTFLSNSKKVKQFSKLNEVAFKKKFMLLFKENPKKNPYLKSNPEWEELFQKIVGVDFSKLKLK